VVQQAALPIGTIVEDGQGAAYEIKGVLGHGGFSVVYKVQDCASRQRIFALKELINPNNQDKRGLLYEADLLMRLRHSSLPRVYRSFENTEHNRIYLLMDYIEGKDLETLRKEQTKGQFSLSLVLALMIPIVKALSYLHEQNPPVVHRDIKPANIIVPFGNADALLVDFGLAKEYVQDKTTSVFRYGTPGYAAPEQYGQGTNPRTDIYALAATIYTLLTGIIPTDALTRSINSHGNDPLQRVDQICPSIPVAVGKVLAHAMALQSEKRFRNVEEFWESLCLAATRQVTNEPDTAPISQAPPSANEVAEYTVGATKKKRKPNNNRSTPLKIGLLVLLPLLFLSVASVTNVFSVQKPQSPPVVKKVITTPTVKPTQSPCSVSSNPSNGDTAYPHLARCYGGTINDIGVAKRKTGLFLTQITQQQGAITGKFQGLGMNGTFKGSVSKDGDLQIIVDLAGRDDVLVLTGSSKIGGDLIGDFEARDSTGNATLGEYGNWNAHQLS
jgi:serine/threonine protein kinase